MQGKPLLRYMILLLNYNLEIRRFIKALVKRCVYWFNPRCAHQLTC